MKKNSIFHAVLAVLILSCVTQASAQRTGGFKQVNLDDGSGAITYMTAGGGSLGVNSLGLMPDPCAILDLNSTTKGFLMPRMNTAQRDALCAIPGMAVFNNSTNSFDYYNGGSWQTLATSSSWLTTLNSLTADGVDNLIGSGATSVVKPFELRVNGNRIARYEINNNIIGGSSSNFIDAAVVPDNVIGGGSSNIINSASAGSVIGGGYGNTVSSFAGTIGGGESNDATGTLSTIVGGYDNTASNFGTFVGGGGYDGVATTGNTASGRASAVVGGMGNTASGDGAFVGAGGIGGVGGGTIAGNQATGFGAGIISGFNNMATNNWAIVAGGNNCNATNISTFVGGGTYNTAAGYRSAIPGGARLTVGDNSFGFNGENTANLVTDPPSNITDLTGFAFTAYFGNVDLWIGNTTSAAKRLRFYENNSSLNYTGANFASIKAPAVLAADYTLTLPVDDGNDGQALITDGTGTLTWGNNLKSTTGGAALQIGTAATANGFVVHSSNLVTNNAGAAPAPANGYSVYTFTGTAYGGAATLPGVGTAGKIVSVINGTGGAILVAVSGGNYTINLNRAAQFISNGTSWYPLSN